MNGSTYKRLVHDGQVMILFAVASLVLIGAVALAVDVGFLLAERRQVQAAADAAAMAAAQSGLDQQEDQIISAGQYYGALNADVPESAVKVNPDAPVPSGGEGERYVEVTITKDVQKFFLQAIYPKGKWSVTASAMAAVEPVEADYALITLDDDTSPGIYMNGNTSISITGDNGSAVSNTTIRGANNPDFDVEGAIHAFGDIIGGENWDPPLGMRANRNRLVPDPLVEAGVEKPDVPDQKWLQEDVDDCLKSSPCNLNPGHYTSVKISMENKDKIHLNPGLFYFDGTSRLDLKNKSELTGDGVLLYFTGGASLTPKNGNINLRASAYVPDDDDGEEIGISHDNIVVWVENCTDVDLQGEGEMYFEGVFYAPCSDSWMHGGTGDTIRGQAVLGTLDVRGNAALRIAYESRVETFQPSVFLVN